MLIMVAHAFAEYNSAQTAYAGAWHDTWKRANGRIDRYGVHVSDQIISSEALSSDLKNLKCVLYVTTRERWTQAVRRKGKVIPSSRILSYKFFEEKGEDGKRHVGYRLESVKDAKSRDGKTFIDIEGVGEIWALNEVKEGDMETHFDSQKSTIYGPVSS